MSFAMAFANLNKFKDEGYTHDKIQIQE